MLEIPQPSECYDYCKYKTIYKSAIVDDTLYFSFGETTGGSDKYDGILSLSMNSKSFDNYKQIIADVDLNKWYIDENSKKIYYAKLNSGNGIIPYEYSIEEGVSVEISNKKYIYDIKYDSGKLLYYTYESDKYDADWNKIYTCNCTPHYELFIYDPNTKKDDLITSDIKDNKNGNMSYIADMINGKIFYYTSDGKIHQYYYDNKSSADYYTIEKKSSYRGFSFIDDKTLKVFYNGGNDQYVENGKNVDSLKEVTITMLDGSINTFTVEDFN